MQGHLNCILLFFFFNDTATTEIYTLSLHDALPILVPLVEDIAGGDARVVEPAQCRLRHHQRMVGRSEEHTSELQSLAYLVCRLLLEKKKKNHRCQYEGENQTLRKHHNT